MSAGATTTARRTFWPVSADMAQRVRAYGLPLVFLLLIVLMAVFADLFGDPNQISATQSFLSPSSEAWLGTDELGRDIAARLAHGARLTLVVSLGSVLIASTIGTAIGISAAFTSGLIRSTLLRAVDVVLGFPPILLAIFVVTFLGSQVWQLSLVLGLLFMPRFARIAYAGSLRIRQEAYVDAATISGAGSWHVIRKIVVPNLLALLGVQAALALGQAVLLETSLSFLGLGPPPPAASWGRMIDNGIRFMSQNGFPILWPSLVITGTIISFNRLGDALRQD